MTIMANNSLLTLLASCETRTWLRWGQELVMREKQEPGPMEVGQVLHVAFDGWMRGLEQEVILAHFDRAWTEVIGEQVPRQERLHWSNVQRCLQHWLDQTPMRPGVTVLQTESTFEVPFGRVNGEEVIYYGTPDALVEWGGELYVLDHKSTGDIDEFWGEQWTMSTGLQGYVWGLRQLGHKVKGAFVNGMEVRRLPPWDGNLEKRCQVHKVKYKECQGLHVSGRWVGPLWWSESRLEQWRRDALTQIGRLQRLREHALYVEANAPAYAQERMAEVMMDGQFRWPGCNGGRGFGPCAYRAFCQAGRPVQGLTQMMVHQDWRRDAVAESVDD